MPAPEEQISAPPVVTREWSQAECHMNVRYCFFRSRIGRCAVGAHLVHRLCELVTIHTDSLRIHLRMLSP